MREELLSLKPGQKKLNKEWMTIGNLVNHFNVTFTNGSSIIEELLGSGHLKVYGQRYYDNQKEYPDMVVERTSKAKTISRSSL